MRITIVIAVLVLAIGLAAYSYPAAAACLFADKNAQSDSQMKILKQASDRIESKFGSLRSRPIIYFFDQQDKYWPLRINPYGSTSFLGYRTCVAIGPLGQNTDVVAHELMHAEIEARAGYWNRTTKIPVWFDEGLAMQVDYRDRYNLEPNVKTAYVTELNSGREFFQANIDTLVLNYGAAKSEVQAWSSMRSPADVYGLLDRIKQGSSFESIWESAE